MRVEWRDWVPLIVVIVLIGAVVSWTYSADRKHCHGVLRSAKTNTDTLIVISSRRCAFVAQESPDAP